MGGAAQLGDDTGMMSRMDLFSPRGGAKQRGGTHKAFDLGLDGKCSVFDGGVALAFVGS